MIALLFFGLCLYFAVGLLFALFHVLQLVGMWLLWWLAPGNAYDHIGRQKPPAPKVPPEQWLRDRGKVPPPIPSEAKRNARPLRRVDENGIPYL